MQRRRMTTFALGMIALTALALALARPVAALQTDPHNHGTGSSRSAQPGSGPAISLSEAHARASEFLARAGLTDLTAGDPVPLAASFYVAVTDPATGAGAFELLVSPDGLQVQLDPGPTMMWNTAYSPMFGANADLLRQTMSADMMGGMMSSMMSGTMGDAKGAMGGDASNGSMGDMTDQGTMDQSMPDGSMSSAADCPSMTGMPGFSAGAAQPLTSPLTVDAAVAQAQTWLTEQVPGATATGPIAFPGYVTVQIERDGRIVGLLSVQTTTGAIWQHAWHGAITDPAASTVSG